MNRQEILERLRAFEYDRGEYWVVTGGAMVLYGIREQTGDIDLGCSAAMADALEAAGCPHRRMADGGRWFRYSRDIEIFEGWLRDSVGTVEGFPVISLRGLLEMKRELGREKDLRDIALIEAFMRREETVGAIKAGRAGMDDIDDLVEMRLEYLHEDHGGFDDGEARAIRSALPGYFRAHLDRDLFAYVVRDARRVASCALLLIVEKPMSPAFPNGKTGVVLNVYTRPECRRKGYARRVMEALLDEARAMEVSAIDLKATAEGRALYRSVGFSDDGSKYRAMRWTNR